MEKLSEKFREVAKHEGVVSIVSWGVHEAHVANTWNSFIVITDDERILIPAYGFIRTQENVDFNQQIKLALGTREVAGFKDYPGTGFIVTGTARFFNSGPEYDMMKEKFSFLKRVLEVTPVSVKQKL